MRRPTQLILAFVTCLGVCLRLAQADLSSLQAQTIAKQAYIYGYPMVDLYRIYYQFFINDKSAEHRHLTNKVYYAPGPFTPDNTTLQSPEADVLYALALLDLRVQPSVVTVPSVAGNRYYSLQFVDQYTYNIAYAGSRTTGRAGGKFLVVGPGWKGTTPPGIKRVIHGDTQFVLALMRMQVFNPQDVANARKAESGYHVQTLSAYLHRAAPKNPASVDWILPLQMSAETRGLDFYNLLAFVAQFCPVDPSERSLWQTFAEIGVRPGQNFESATLSTQRIKELRWGMEVGQLDVLGQRQALTSSFGLFGDRSQRKTII